MRSIFSLDGKQWVYGDVFGITRLDLHKQPKVSKHTLKVTNPMGALSISRDGKLGAVDGRAHTGAGGDPAFVCFGLPGLGVKVKEASQVAGLMTCSLGDRIVRLERDNIEVCVIDGQKLISERVVILPSVSAGRPLALGPSPAYSARPVVERAPARLRVLPDGRYAALTQRGVLCAGRLGAEAAEDEGWWNIKFEHDPVAEVSLEVVGEDVWVCVMEVAEDTAHMCRITRAGERTVWAIPSLCPPAPTRDYVYYQPSSDEVRRRSLRNGAQDVYQVGAHNPHPQPDHSDDVYQGSPRPPAPTRLPGHVAASEGRAFFVPWHGEVIVDLQGGSVMARGLEPEGGVFRRMISEILTRNNQALCALNTQCSLSAFDHNAKRRTTPIQHTLPWLPSTLAFAVAGHMATNLTDRFNLNASGWRWGSSGVRGGADWPGEFGEPVSLDDARAAVAWMIRADYLPIEAPTPLLHIYERQLRIQIDYGREEAPKLSGDPERLYLRAMLETLRACGWPVVAVPDAWATEPITAEMACDAIEGIKTWRRYKPYHAIQALCFALTSHLGADAVAPLLKLITDFPTPLMWEQYHNAGERLVWLCHRQPALTARVAAALRAVHHADDGWAYNAKDQILSALEERARDL
jgi:hypothetical protein